MRGIDGLLYIPNYLSPQQHDAVINAIDAQPWRGDLSRRTQQYGYIYDYRARRVGPDSYLGPLPSWLALIASQLHADGVMPQRADQAIINEYTPGQGVADHIDCTPCFGDVIVSLSLGSSVVMDLKRSSANVPILLEQGSLLVLRGIARYRWTHGIAKRRQDVIEGIAHERKRRVSITFRTVIVAPVAKKLNDYHEYHL
jgi:alkylated DNA repair dioxygenase AlkB